MSRILIIDDEESSCRTLKLHFGQRGFEVETALSADEGLAKLLANPTDIVVSDIHMPGRDGFSLLGEIRERLPDIPVIMITAFHDLDSTVAAMHGGAVDYVPKPIDLEELEAAVDRAIKLRSGYPDDGLVLDSRDVTNIVVGKSHAMKEVFKSIGMVSQSRVTVLISGESGTGKDLVARAIHKVSPGSDHPFVSVNCAALAETFLESEFFGHDQGAFADAAPSRKGKVELAGEGTVFLGEISELSPYLQAKLLRLLEDREFTPVGGTRTVASHARFIVGTTVDLAERVANRQFREDLYYKLNVVNISLPPLRQRREDIPLLVEHLVKKINREIHKDIRRIPSGVMDMLEAYDWPGNVRQLENVLKKAVVMAQGDTLSLSEMADGPGDDPGARPPAVGGAAETDQDLDMARSLKDLEREHIKRVLAITGWHKGRTCEILGISRPRLERRIAEYGFTRDD
jgi:DNA-binding NtrC family response regulator